MTGWHECNSYRMIDLFAGIGGIRLGFECAFGPKNLETVFVSEFDKYAARTYAANFDTPEDTIEGLDGLLMDVDGARIYGDIREFVATDGAVEKIPDFDICLAGFPCQAFSYAGKRLGLDDDYKGMARGTLFRELITICEKRKPKVVFCENVKGLLTHDRGRTFEIIKGAFEQIGYRVFYQVLNSKNFDVPQNRERLYIVAFRKDIAPERFDFPEGEETERRIADILEEAPIPARYYLTSQYLDTLKRHKAHHELLGHGFGYRIKEWNGIASTLSCGGMGRERNLLVDDRQHETEYKTTRVSKMNGEHVRQMTPREWARLQGFDDSFILPEGNSYMYKQLGNTVTVPVIEAIATKIKSVLTGYYNGYGVLNQVICSAILYELETAEKSRRELLEVVGYLFPTTYSEENKLARLSSALQALKRRGEILSTGKTRSSVWHLNRNQPEKLLDAELKHFEMLTFAGKPASREERLVGVI